MTSSEQATSVTASIVVDVPVEHAFRIYTEQIHTWWNSDHVLLDAPLEAVVLEPGTGGRILARGTDGSECAWSRILDWDPPHRLLFSWDITLQWTIEADPDRCSEVDVTFTPVTAKQTRVQIEHRHLDRHGEGWESMATSVGAADGWAHDLKLFAAAAHG